MYGLRKREKVSGRWVWAYVEYDPIGRMWHHIEGTPGVPSYLFPTKRKIIEHMNENNLDAMDWEIIEEAPAKRGPEREPERD